VSRETGPEDLLREIRRLREVEAEAARRSALYASAEEIGQIGSWEFRGDELIWSENLYRLFGYEPGEVTPSPELVFAHTHADDRARVERTVRTLRETGEFPPALEYRIRVPGRGVRHLRATLAVLERRGGRPSRMIGAVFDITDQRRAEREIAAHVAVSHALVEWRSLDHGARLLLRNLAEAIEYDCGVLWLPADGALTARVVWHSGTLDPAASTAVADGRSFRPGTGLPGRAWRERRPINCPRTDDRSFIRRDAALRAGLRGAVAFPAIHAEEVLAVIELFSSEEALLPDGLVQSLTGIGYEIGHFLAGRRGELRAVGLTARELEVLQLAARGSSGPEIARRLGVGATTVKTHFEHVYGKLGVGDRASAVASGLRLGLIE
jgi:DNA-binding CsgD family transcriptional regulator